MSNSTSETTRSAQALHRVLVKTRYLALQGEAPERLAAILDWAELLAQDIAANEDGHEFAAHLQGLGDDLPEFAGIFRDYQGGCL